jgi:hypothetical protein
MKQISQKCIMMTMAALVVAPSLMKVESAGATPRIAAGTADREPLVSLTGGKPGVHRYIGIVQGNKSSWRNEGDPYYFENCWWQRQQFYSNGQPTGHVRNKKNSCPGLSFGADAIQRPSVRLPGLRH